ncbi:PH domain-containing protein, variant 3 [Balamuthia mandrillaris]
MEKLIRGGSKNGAPHEKKDKQQQQQQEQQQEQHSHSHHLQLPSHSQHHKHRKHHKEKKQARKKENEQNKKKQKKTVKEDTALTHSEFVRLSAPVTKQGRLSTKNFWGRWKEGWFVLKLNYLAEYKYEGAAKPVKIMDVSHVIIRQAESLTGRPFSFSLARTVTKGHKKSKDMFFLQAQDNKEMNDWITLLCEQSREGQAGASWQTTQENIDNFSLQKHDVVVVTDQRGTVLGVSTGFDKFYGYTKEEIVGQSVSVLMESHMAQMHHKFMTRYEQSREKRLIGKPRPLRARRKDGSVTTIELILTEVFEGEECRFVAIMRPYRLEDSTTSDEATSETTYLSDDEEEDAAEVEDQTKTLSRKLYRCEKTNLIMKDMLFGESLQKLNKDVHSWYQQTKSNNKSSSSSSSSVVDQPLSPRLRPSSNLKNYDYISYTKKLISQEIKETSSVSLLFRADSSVTRLLGHLNMIFGLEYLELAIGKEIRSILHVNVAPGTQTNQYAHHPHHQHVVVSGGGSCPVIHHLPSAPSRDNHHHALPASASKDSKEGATHQRTKCNNLAVISVEMAKKIVKLSKTILGAILKSEPQCPREIRELAAHLRHKTQKKFPELDLRVSVGGYLFLRFFCPAIVSPQYFGLVAEEDYAIGSPEAQNLIGVSKVRLHVLVPTLASCFASC